MKEHPDYKYRPRRKPKPILKKELGRYPFPFPFLPQGLDPLSPLARHLLSYPVFPPDKARMGMLPAPLPLAPAIKEEEESGSEVEEDGRGASPWSRPPSPSFTFPPRRQDSPSHPDSTTSPAPLMVRVPSPPTLPKHPSSLTSTSHPYPSFTMASLSSRHQLPLSDLLPSYPSLYPHLFHPSLYPHLVPSYLLHHHLPPLLPALSPPPPLHIARPIPKLPTSLATVPTLLATMPTLLAKSPVVKLEVEVPVARPGHQAF